jgi:hypothetical protein
MLGEKRASIVDKSVTSRFPEQLPARLDHPVRGGFST